MIRSFNCRETKKIFDLERSGKFPYEIQTIALRKLRMLDNAITLNDIRIPPANCLEKLRGDRDGQYSIRINGQWRICFRWNGKDVFQVEIVDYH